MVLPRRFLWVLVSILLAGAGLAAVLMDRFPARPGMTRLSVGVAAVPGGVSTGELKGLRLLLAACIEDDNHLPVSEEEKLGEEALPTSRLTLGGRRVGEFLELDLTLTHPTGVRETFRMGPGDFREVYRALLKRLRLRDTGVDRLLPSRPGAGWSVVQALSYVPAQPMPPVGDALQRALEVEPTCPLLWGARALVIHVELANGTSRDPMDLQRCDEAFRESLALAPRTPVLVYLFAIFKAETGDVSEALDLTFEAAPYKPYSLYLLGAEAYAARQAGLWEGARRAVAEQERHVGPLRWFANSVENTWLYTGEWQRFEDALGTSGPTDADPYLDFYRGYIRLLRGRSREAAPFFARCARNPGAPGDFARLGNVYHLYLGGEPAQALEALRTMYASRLPLATADGELTLKLAEAFARLGAPEEALEAAHRAVQQGFTCLRWFDESPLLRDLHGHPEWKTLRRTVQDRLTQLQTRYPSERFGG